MGKLVAVAALAALGVSQAMACGDEAMMSYFLGAQLRAPGPTQMIPDEGACTSLMPGSLYGLSMDESWPLQMRIDRVAHVHVEVIEARDPGAGGVVCPSGARGYLALDDVNEALIKAGYPTMPERADPSSQAAHAH